MSLDVYLNLPGAKPKGSGSGIFVRKNGSVYEIPRSEWELAFPGREPYVVQQSDDSPEVFQANITHNLNRMAEAAGIYECLWRPDEHGFTNAGQLIQPLREGLAVLKDSPDKFMALNPENGWGSYDDFVPWVERYLAACEAFPEAEVSVSR